MALLAPALCFAFAAALFDVHVHAATKATTPRFKWGQSKEQIYLSVIVRDLDKDSVKVSLPSDGEFSFRAKSTSGEDFALDLELREDVHQDTMKYEVAARSDKWGTAVMTTLNKQTHHRWDILVTNPKKYKSVMDKDWSREDQKLEPEEELPYLEDNKAYLTPVTQKSLEKLLKKYDALVVNVRYPWCSQCKSQDETFLKGAKQIKKKSKTDSKWKNIAFGVLDAREERSLARKLGAKCDYTCEYKVFAESTDSPVVMKSKWTESELLAEIQKYLSPAVNILKSKDELSKLQEKNTTCFGTFASDKSSEYGLFRKVANIMRGELVFAAWFGGQQSVELKPLEDSATVYSDGFDDNGTKFLKWVKPRALPALQAYSWQMRETYEGLGLPLAKVWLDEDEKDKGKNTDSSNYNNNSNIREVMRDLAKRFVGKIAFVEQSKSMYSYELRDFGLSSPEVYPAFGIASNASYQAIKYGFEITPAVAPSVKEFWDDKEQATAKLTGFCEKVLAGEWPEAHESEVPQTNWTEGTVKKVTWKSSNELLAPVTPLLLEVYGKYRQDHEKKIAEVDFLATTLAPYASQITIARYDSTDNYVPPVFGRDKYSHDTEWWFLPQKTGTEQMMKLTKPKKDTPLKTVIKSLAKQIKLPDDDVKQVIAKYEEWLKDYLEKQKAMKKPDLLDHHDHEGGQTEMEL